MTEPTPETQYAVSSKKKQPVQSLMLMRRKAHEMGIIVERQLLEMGALKPSNRLFVARAERRSSIHKVVK